MFGINDGNFMVLVNKIMILIILFNGKFLHIVVVDTQGGYMMQVVLIYVYFRVVYPARRYIHVSHVQSQRQSQLGFVWPAVSNVMKVMTSTNSTRRGKSSASITHSGGKPLVKVIKC